MKKPYEPAEIEIILLETEDIISTSGDPVYTGNTGNTGNTGDMAGYIPTNP